MNVSPTKAIISIKRVVGVSTFLLSPPFFATINSFLDYTLCVTTECHFFTRFRSEKITLDFLEQKQHVVYKYRPKHCVDNYGPSVKKGRNNEIIATALSVTGTKSPRSPLSRHHVSSIRIPLSLNITFSLLREWVCAYDTARTVLPWIIHTICEWNIILSRLMFFAWINSTTTICVPQMWDLEDIVIFDRIY